MLVVGAGVSGLKAARDLQAMGAKVNQSLLRVMVHRLEFE